MRILLAEDERSLSRAVCALLQKNNYSVDPVYDGREALEYLETENYDAVILDWMMPQADGLTVLRAMRERGDATPVLFLTARGEIDDKVLGLDSGANDYLTKPFAVRELLARLRAMTRTGAAQTDARLRVGNVTLDCASYELSGPRGCFRLANREFQMMEMLMRQPKNLISAEHFMERVWGFESEAEISVVWVYISYLRKKLAAVGASIHIKAQRNAGYYLEEEL